MIRSFRAAVFLGGLVRRISEKPAGGRESDGAGAGILSASGFVAGEELAGVVDVGRVALPGPGQGPCYRAPRREVAHEPGRVAGERVVPAVDRVQLSSTESCACVDAGRLLDGTQKSLLDDVFGLAPFVARATARRR